MATLDHQLQPSESESSGREITFRPLQPGEDSSAFRLLNQEWIEKYFTLEAKDRETLNHPEKNILAKGGRIFFAHSQGVAVGCVALIPTGDRTYELAKMAVSPRLRGQGIGRRLLQYAIAQASELGAQTLFLASSTKLENAVHLYESVGFRHIPPASRPASEYARSDVFMDMVF
jgi:N-acetylglutamate synthase-like GNAT family acetyltransferase